MTLNSDVMVDGKQLTHHELARALHRVVRAMHDGHCPKCGHLGPAEVFQGYNRVEMGEDGQEIATVEKHACPVCQFTITADEARAAMAEFQCYMVMNCVAFEQWRDRQPTIKAFYSKFQAMYDAMVNEWLIRRPNRAILNTDLGEEPGDGQPDPYPLLRTRKVGILIDVNRLSTAEPTALAWLQAKLHEVLYEGTDDADILWVNCGPTVDEIPGRSQFKAMFRIGVSKDFNGAADLVRKSDSELLPKIL